MTPDQIRQQIEHLENAAAANCAYHRTRETRWRCADRVVKLLVVALAVVSLWATIRGPAWPGGSAGPSFCFLAIAVALNVLPFSDWSKFHGREFHRWTDRRRAIALEMRTRTEELADDLAADAGEPSPRQSVAG